jgi:hypothetical protein
VAIERRPRRIHNDDDSVTLVDTSVLPDVLTDDPAWGSCSQDALADARDRGRPRDQPIVYAEVLTELAAIEVLDDAVPVSDLSVPLPYNAGFMAGKAFVAYRRRGRQRRSPLPDFYIGAHAAVAGYRQLSRDKTRYRTYSLRSS